MINIMTKRKKKWKIKGKNEKSVGGGRIWVHVKHVVYKIQDGEVTKQEKNVKKKRRKRAEGVAMATKILRGRAGVYSKYILYSASAHNWRITKIIEIKPPLYMHTNLFY